MASYIRPSQCSAYFACNISWTHPDAVCPPPSQLLTCPRQPPLHPGPSRQSPHPLPLHLRHPPGRGGKVGWTLCERRGSTRILCLGTYQCHRAAACHSCAAPWSSCRRPGGWKKRARGTGSVTLQFTSFNFDKVIFVELLLIETILKDLSINESLAW